MAGEDPDYIHWLKGQPCNQCGAQRGCDAHHRTGAGMGMRAHDHLAMPMCRYCHDTFHASSGSFKTMEKQARRAYQDEAIQRCRRVYSSKAPGG